MASRLARTPLPLRLAAALFAGLMAAGSPIPAARADQIRTLDLDVQEDVLAIEGEGDALTLRTASRSIPAIDVKEVRFAGADRDLKPGSARLFLVTGDELAGEVVKGSDSKVTIQTPSLGTLEVPLDRVRAIAYTREEADLRRFRKEVLPLEVKGDVAVTRSWSRQEGILERIDEKGIAFTTDALGTVPLGPEKIIGARVRQFGKPPAAPPGLRARIELVDGGVVFGKLKGSRDGTLNLDTAYKPGLEVKAAEARTLSFLNGKIVYVSDLTPVEVEERADKIDVVFKHRVDSNVMGNPLRLDGKTFRKGLGVHSFTRLLYRIDGGFVRFRATIGLDDEAREIARTNNTPGAVKFQVLLDGKPAPGEYGGGITLTTSDAPRLIDVPVGGAGTIALVAHFASVDVPDCLARGAWADATLIKK